MDQQQPLICPAHTNQYIGVTIIGIIIGTAASFVYFKQTSVNEAQTYQAGFNAARKLVEESSLGNFFKVQDDVRSLSGNITAVAGNRLTLHVQAMNNPFDKESINDRTVVTDANTKIIKLTPIDQKTYQTELAKFMSTSRSATSTKLIPPQQFTQTVVSFGDTKVGDSVIVTAGENIKNAREFTASEIQIQPIMFIK